MFTGWVDVGALPSISDALDRKVWRVLEEVHMAEAIKGLARGLDTNIVDVRTVLKTLRGLD